MNTPIPISLPSISNSKDFLLAFVVFCGLCAFFTFLSLILSPFSTIFSPINSLSKLCITIFFAFITAIFALVYEYTYGS